VVGKPEEDGSLLGGGRPGGEDIPWRLAGLRGDGRARAEERTSTRRVSLSLTGCPVYGCSRTKGARERERARRRRAERIERLAHELSGAHEHA
jgi:hypothetical protein